MRFGVHVSIAGGVDQAPQRAADLGCDCFQLFVANPRSWSLPKLSEAECDAFRRARRRLRLGPVVVHLTYLPNCASPDRALREKSRRHLLHQYQSAAALGADLFVIHPGSHRGAGLEDGVARLADCINEALAAVPEGPVFLLENTAGGGDTIGRNPEELGAIFAAVAAPERLGLCLDTCHAWATGVEVGRPQAFRQLLTAHEATAGKGTVRLIHANDCPFPCGSGRDRHEHIGQGEIGRAGFRRALHTRGVRRLSWILETPVNEQDDDRQNLATIRELAQ